MNAKDLVSKMTLEEKASLCSGQSFWHSQAIERLGLPEIMMTDGPHGLRKQKGMSDHLGLFDSVPATCFPTACSTANSFNPSLLAEIGKAIAEECLQEEVSVVLGPGLNIKRSPLCGRNFEYFSEDPLLSGEMTAAITDGIQSQGVGVSLKHFAANNQEWCRMVSDSVVDDRALREIYLTAFEMAVKRCKPWTVMSSYNKINGTYVAENKWLLTEVLREEWGFDGLVVTDWGGIGDRVKGVKAGVDLEMPSSRGVNDAKVLEAVKSGLLKEEELDKVVLRVVELVLKGLDGQKKAFVYDADAHHKLAQRAAAESSVLLKNKNGILPLKKEATVAVIGAFAKEPRYQGAGSSKIVPSRLDNILDSLKAFGVTYEYAEGYSLEAFSPPDEAKIKQACEIAKGKESVIIFAGLPGEYESEGFDRKNLDMPDSHNKLIEAVSAVNSNVVVVLQLGSPVVMPWDKSVSAILLSYLGGQAGSGACVDLLYGKTVPSAKLAETWPKVLSDTPCYKYFPGGTKSVQYRESIFVGYRYYDTVDLEPAYPFGHGLSYTEFAYSDLEISENTASFTVTNVGKVAGAEVSQLYVGLKDSRIFRAAKELKGFSRTELEAGESKRVEIPLGRFTYYNTEIKDWATEGGEYTIYIAASISDIKLKGHKTIKGDGHEEKLAWQGERLPVYFNLPKGLEIPEEQFKALYGDKTLPPLNRVEGEPYTFDSTLRELSTSKAKRIVDKIKAGIMERMQARGEEFARLAVEVVMSMPLRAMSNVAGDRMNAGMLEGILDMANGKRIRGMIKIIKHRPKS